MKKLSLLNINRELSTNESLKIVGGVQDCSCTGSIYPSFSTEKGGLHACLCDDGYPDPPPHGWVKSGC